VNAKSVGAKLELTDLETSATMKCTAIEMYNVLTRPEVMHKYEPSFILCSTILAKLMA